MKNSQKTTIATGTGLLTGGLVLGALFSPIGLAGAQDGADEPDTSGSDAVHESEDGELRRSPGRHLLGRALLGDVIDELGLTEEQVREGHAAGQTLAETAEANGVPTEVLVAALVDAADARLVDAVAEERITEERAAELRAELEERITGGVTSTHVHRGWKRLGLDALEELGITVEELRAGREAGETLAETAAANGVDEDTLVDALVAAAIERGEEAVENGRITSEQLAERTADLETRVTERVNTEPGERRGRR